MVNYSHYEALHLLIQQKALLRGRTYSSFQSNIMARTEFAYDVNNLQLPLKVGGRLITSGTYKEGEGEFILPENELKKCLKDWEGKEIWKSHGSFWGNAKGSNVPIDDIVGKITSAVWNPIEKAIDWFGEVYDLDVARKIVGGLIKHVSVGFMNMVKKINGALHKVDIEPTELSLVYNPRDKAASIAPM